MMSLLWRKFFRRVSGKLLLSIVVFMCYYFGAFTYFFTVDYDSSFDDSRQENILTCATALSRKAKSECTVINNYDYNFFILNELKCKNIQSIQLVIVVKSAIEHFDRRQAIRQTWGFEDRFSDVTIRKVFIIGTDNSMNTYHRIHKENEKYGDIVFANFVDSYYNNTIKTMMAFKWIVNYCHNSKFYLFSDDDMYISVKNVLRFVRNPTEYPSYLETSDHPAVSNFNNRGLYYELPENVKLLSGFVMVSSPHRHRCSKWFVSLDEYPYNKWPPYVSAGSFILSKEAARLIYYGSFFTKHFRFDDIYLGLVAKSLNIEPFHCSAFNIFEKKYDPKEFKYVISFHGYHSDELMRIWEQQKSLGNA